ncbi:MAG: RNA methyltransferase, partial [Croceitalea sp.]|nr:RNA methyltransferase [Croceitalea sp.]
MRKLANNELERLTIEEFKRVQKIPLTLVLDNVRSLNNIGSVFRTADAFLVNKIFLCGITAQPPHKDIQKTALGSTESVAWEYREHTIDLVHELKEKGYQVFSIEQAEKTIMLNDFNTAQKQQYALIFGNEVKGVAQDVVSISDGVIEIPQFGTKHSLNIAVTA